MTPKKKLIEVALPLDAINKASAREKSIRHGHPSTLHLWWARRPLAAARAVIFAQMVDDPSAHPDIFKTEKAQEKERQRLFRIIKDLVLWEKPLGGQKLTVIAWLWARTVRSPNPAFAHVEVPLASTFMLSRMKGNEAFVDPSVEVNGYRFDVKVAKPKDVDSTNIDFARRVVLSSPKLSPPVAELQPDAASAFNERRFPYEPVRNLRARREKSHHRCDNCLGATNVPGKCNPKKTDLSAVSEDTLFVEVLEMIQAARGRALSAVNTAVVVLYWQLVEYISRKLKSVAWRDGAVDALTLYI